MFQNKIPLLFISALIVAGVPAQAHAFSYTQVHSLWQDPTYVSNTLPDFTGPGGMLGVFLGDPVGAFGTFPTYQAMCDSYATAQGYTNTTDFYCVYDARVVTGSFGTPCFGTACSPGVGYTAVYNGYIKLYTTTPAQSSFAALTTQLNAAWTAYFNSFITPPTLPVPTNPQVCPTGEPYQAFTSPAFDPSASSPQDRCNIYHHVGAPASPPVASLTAASPSMVAGSGSNLLTYSCSNGATSASIDNGVGSVTPAASGNAPVTPGVSTTYRLTCTNANGSSIATAPITVVPVLTASCSVSPTSISAGATATWTAVTSGGTGTYTYTWSGTDGLTGSGSFVTFPYGVAGPKTASVTVTSGTQSITSACSNTLTVNPAAACTVTSAQWYSGGTQTVIAFEGLPAPYDCAIDAQNQGYQYWNRRVVDDSGSADRYTTTCWGVTGQAGTIPKPATLTNINSRRIATSYDSGTACAGVVQKPDLIAALATPPSAVVGTPVLLQGTVTNSATTKGTGAVFTDLFQVATDASGTGATDIGTFPNAALSGGASNPASLSYIFPSAGTYYVRICADKSSSASTGVITESNEGNNCAGAGGANWTAITVGSGGIPTLACTATPATLGATGGTATWTVTPSGGAVPPYTWTPIGFSGYSVVSPTQVSHVFTSADAGSSYTMHVAASNVPSGIDCTPSVAVGSAACGGSPTGTLTANPNRIRANTSTSITFTLPSIQNVKTFCTLSGPGMATPPAPFNPNSCTVSGSFTTNITIATQSTYTLTCDGLKTATTIINVLPNFQEF